MHLQKSFRRILLLFSLLGTFFISFSGELTAARKPDAYELHIWKFKSDISFEQGKVAAEELNASYKKLEGFEKRHLYFDKEQNMWIDQIKWKHRDAAKKGRESLAKDPAMQKFEELWDKTSVKYFKSEKLFEVGV